MQLFCIVGPKACGKTTFAKVAEKEYPVIYVMDIIKDFLFSHNFDTDDQSVEEAYIDNIGEKPETLANKVIEKALSLPGLDEKNMIFVDDVKSIHQLRTLKQKFPVKIVSILAKKENRAKRGGAMNVVREQAFDIYKLQNQADYRLFNNSSLHDFEEHAKHVLDEMKTGKI